MMNSPRNPLDTLSWPHTRAGVLAVALSALFLVVFGLNQLTSGDDNQNGALVFATFVTALGMVAGLVLSAVAFLRRKERSLLILLPLVVGVLVVAFLAVEILVGHD